MQFPQNNSRGVWTSNKGNAGYISVHFAKPHDRENGQEYDVKVTLEAIPSLKVRVNARASSPPERVSSNLSVYLDNQPVHG